MGRKVGWIVPWYYPCKFSDTRGNTPLEKQKRRRVASRVCIGGLRKVAVSRIRAEYSMPIKL